MSHLKKIGDIIGSLLTGQGFNRKRCRDDDVDIVKSGKKGRIIHSLDREAFMGRVASFTWPGWGGRKVGPLLLARFGWEALKEEQLMVRCTSCQESLYLKLPPLSSGVYQKCVDIQCERVVSAHADFCPWSTTPCPPSFAQLDAKVVEVKERAAQLVKLGNKLPYIGAEYKEQWKPVFENLANELSGEDEVVEVSAVLAVAGWRVGKQEGVLEDLYSTRHAGLWNFVSLLEHQDRMEAQETLSQFKEPRVRGDDDKRHGGGHPDVENIGEDLGAEDNIQRQIAKGMLVVKQSKPEDQVYDRSDDDVEEDVSEDKENCDGKTYFDPLKEHHSWNPLVVEDGKGEAGWEVVKEAVAKSYDEDQQKQKTGQLDTPSYRQPMATLQRVRSLLDQW